MPRGLRVDLDVDQLLALVREGLTNAEIANALGCTVRTIDRRRAADPDLTRAIIQARAEIAAANEPDHGTYQRYRRGCHCRPCADANTIRCRETRYARRARLGLPPPNPSRGRPRSVAETTMIGAIVRPTQQTLIEQAIARGERTTVIMQRLGCDYEAVATVREQLTEAAAS